MLRPSANYARRRRNDRLMTATMVIAVVVSLVPLIAILFFVLKQGLPAINLELLTDTPRPPSLGGGGVWNSIAGSAVMVSMALCIGAPVAIGCGIFLAEFGQNRPGNVLRFLIDVLAGVPSITIGLFIYGLVVVPMQGFSAIAGSMALALLLIPVVSRITEEMLLLVPRSLREGAFALGATHWRVALGIVFPAALPGIATGLMLGLSRIAGEAAPLLFTALGNQFFSTDVTGAMDALPMRIYFYATGPYEVWHAKAWGMSLLLVLAILVISLIVRRLAGSRVTVRM
jgi:phosphate transport system permease protein